MYTPSIIRVPHHPLWPRCAMVFRVPNQRVRPVLRAPPAQRTAPSAERPRRASAVLPCRRLKSTTCAARACVVLFFHPSTWWLLALWKCASAFGVRVQIDFQIVCAIRRWLACVHVLCVALHVARQRRSIARMVRFNYGLVCGIKEWSLRIVEETREQLNTIEHIN